MKKEDLKKKAQAVVQQQTEAQKKEFRIKTGIKAAMADFI